MKPLSLLLFLVALAVAESEVAHAWERIYFFAMYQLENIVWPDINNSHRRLAPGCVGVNGGPCDFIQVRLLGPCLWSSVSSGFKLVMAAATWHTSPSRALTAPTRELSSLSITSSTEQDMRATCSASPRPPYR